MKKKLVSILLIISMIFVLFCGCGNKKADENSPDNTGDVGDTENSDEETPYTYEKLGFTADDVIIKVNGEDVTAEEFFYWMDYAVEYLTYFSGEVFPAWDEVVYEDLTASEYVLHSAIDTLRWCHVFAKNAADYGGAELTEEDLQEIEVRRQDYIQNYFSGMGDYESALIDYGISDEMFVKIYCTMPYIYDKVFENMYQDNFLETVGEDKAQAYADEKGYLHAAHILFFTIDEDTYEPLTEDEIASKRLMAETTLGYLDEGSDFFELMNLYSEDRGKAEFPNGYHFVEGEMIDEFYQGALALEENQYSGIIESSYGYHIILRLPVDLNEIAKVVCEDEYEQLVDKWSDEAEIEYTDNYYMIIPEALYGTAEADK